MTNSIKFCFSQFTAGK
ncbi:peptide IlvX [Trabulsiella odontotermitis]